MNANDMGLLKKMREELKVETDLYFQNALYPENTDHDEKYWEGMHVATNAAIIKIQKMIDHQWYTDKKHRPRWLPRHQRPYGGEE